MLEKLGRGFVFLWLLGRALVYITLKRGRERDCQGVSYQRPSGAREMMFGVSCHRVCTMATLYQHLICWAGKSFLFGLLASGAAWAA